MAQQIKPLIVFTQEGAQAPKATPRRGLRLPRLNVRRFVSELIDGPQRLVRRFFSNVDTTRHKQDAGKTDYGFWDRARSGRARGLEMSGLLLKPLYSKVAAWTMGIPPMLRLDNAKAQQRLNDWWQEHQSEIVQAFEESNALGDYFIIVNADLSITAKTPNLVYPIVDELDFSKIVGWHIEEIFEHPTEPGQYQTHINRYTTESRTQIIRSSNSNVISARTFRNLIGRVPVIHIPNRKRADEVFGHSEAEALVELLHTYGEVLEAGAEGNIRQGRPTPVIEQMGSAESVKQFMDLYGQQRTQELPDGTTEVENYVDFDADKLMALPGDATFNWKSPPPFIGEVAKLLELLYYLYLEHVELPEWVLGNAIASSRASAETQVDPLVKFIETKRSHAEKWVIELAMVVLGYMGVVDVATRSTQRPTIKWEDMTTKDGNLTLNALNTAYEKGLIDDETYLTLTPLEIEDIPATLRKAREEREARQQQDQENSISRALDDARRRGQEADRQAEADDEDEEDTPELRRAV